MPGLTIPLVLWANGRAAGTTTHEEMQFPEQEAPASVGRLNHRSLTSIGVRTGNAGCQHFITTRRA